MAPVPRRRVRWIRALFLALVALIVIVLLLFGFARLRSPTAAQAAAVAHLQIPPPPSGRNAFDLIWVMPYAVPEDQVDAVVADDVQRFAQWPLLNVDLWASTATGEGAANAGANAPEPPSFESVAVQRFGPLAGTEKSRPSCGFSEDCLAWATARPHEAATWLHGSAALIDRLNALHDTTHFRNAFTWRVDMPMPPFKWLSALPALRAATFVGGRRADAVAATCADIGMWRRLSADADSLVFSMVAARALAVEVRLLNGMFDAEPAGLTPPPSCETALARGPGEEFVLCSAMRGEAAFMQSAHRQIGVADLTLIDRLQRRLLYDADHAQALAAQNYAAFCTADATARVRDDVAQIAPPAPTCDMLSYVGDPMGCVLSSVAAPSFIEYAHRRQDMGAWVRAARVAQRIRVNAQAGVPPERTLAQVLQEPAMAGRPMRWEPSSQSLVWPLFYTKRGDEGRLQVRLRDGVNTR